MIKVTTLPAVAPLGGIRVGLIGLSALLCVSASLADEFVLLDGKRFKQDLQAEEGKEDILYVSTKEKMEVVKGGIQELGPERLTFVWGDVPRKLALSKVFGIVVAKTGQAPGFLGRVCCKLREGSEVW